MEYRQLIDESSLAYTGIRGPLLHLFVKTTRILAPGFGSGETIMPVKALKLTGITYSDVGNRYQERNLSFLEKVASSNLKKGLGDFHDEQQGIFWLSELILILKNFFPARKWAPRFPCQASLTNTGPWEWLGIINDCVFWSTLKPFHGLLHCFREARALHLFQETTVRLQGREASSRGCSC